MLDRSPDTEHLDLTLHRRVQIAKIGIRTRLVEGHAVLAVLPELRRVEASVVGCDRVRHVGKLSPGHGLARFNRDFRGIELHIRDFNSRLANRLVLILGLLDFCSADLTANCTTFSFSIGRQKRSRCLFYSR